MKRVIVVGVLLCGGLAWGDNCYVFDRSTDEGRQHYEECKDQARQMERAQDQLNQYVDQSNRRNEADWAGAQQEQTNLLLQALQKQNEYGK